VTELDLAIVGGTVVDGSGLPRYRADVGISDGRIVRVGRLAGAPARETIDASGQVVSPGFIDPHTHLDPQLCWDPAGTPSVHHGVTTVLTGNCSLSLAPCRPEDRDPISRMFYRIEDIPLDSFKAGVKWSWESFADYAAAMREQVAINLAALVGHSTLRYFAMGAESFERPATSSELSAMCEGLAESIEGGAIGLSTSRLVFHVGEGGRPIPSVLASDDELEALCRVMGDVGRGFLQTDPGATGRDTSRYIREVLAPIAERTGVAILMSGTVQEAGAPHLWREVHDLIASYQEQGLRIFTQANPCRIDGRFTLVRTLSFNDMPTWRSTIALDHDAKLAAFRDPDIRDAMQYEAVDSTEPAFFSRRWETVQILEVTREHNKWMIGMNVQELAEKQGKRVIDTILDLALDEDLKVAFLAVGRANGDEAAVAAQLRSQQAIVGSSDAGAHVTQMCGAGDTSLLLSKWVRETKSLSLEEAVHAITFKTSSVLGLEDRGLLRPGYAADVVVFDPDAVAYLDTRFVADLPGGGERLWRDSAGIRHVLVNGQAVVEDGRLTGKRPGRVLA
jgi:N-acyl-D-aspartate/D-glutamate deacylase